MICCYSVEIIDRTLTHILNSHILNMKTILLIVLLKSASAVYAMEVLNLSPGVIGSAGKQVARIVNLSSNQMTNTFMLISCNGSKCNDFKDHLLTNFPKKITVFMPSQAKEKSDLAYRLSCMILIFMRHCIKNAQ